MALVQCLSTVYDEAQQISAVGRAAYPHIPWSQLDAMVELVSQNTLDFDAIWRTVSNKFPHLLDSLNLTLGQNR